jgi:multicomponent Na+:H+ antiporter subunit G
MIEALGYGFITLGIVFDFFGALSLVRFREVYSRLLGSTKCVTLGTACIMLGVFIINGWSATGIKALLCALFVLITSPVTAHALSRAGFSAGIRPDNETKERE